ncbi:MAG: BrnT family toxin [Burkholderiales bacterium]|nr:BrnT family toxin [Burkholderiales bacterium]
MDFPQRREHPADDGCTDACIAENLRHRDQEARFHALGKTLDGRALHITFTLRGDGTLIRVISARDMHRKERSVYDQAR